MEKASGAALVRYEPMLAIKEDMEIRRVWEWLLEMETRRELASVGDEEKDGLPVRQLYRRLIAARGPLPPTTCFWGGREGRRRAQREPDARTDADCPITSGLFDLWKQARSARGGQPDAGLVRVAFAISQLFAVSCRGKVKIFISSDKASERAGFTVGTKLWEAELPMLQAGRLSGRVTSLLCHFYDGEWSRGLELEELPAELPIWRRHWHPVLDSAGSRASFVTPHMQGPDFDDWRHRPPRPFIRLGTMRATIRRWRERTRPSTPEGEKSPSPSIEKTELKALPPDALVFLL